jgi:hypothetical protein
MSRQEFLEPDWTLSSERFIRALERGGFVVFRRDPIATILERGMRAVAVPNTSRLSPQTILMVRRMTGLSRAELDALLANDELPRRD